MNYFEVLLRLRRICGDGCVDIEDDHPVVSGFGVNGKPVVIKNVTEFSRLAGNAEYFYINTSVKPKNVSIVAGFPPAED